MTDSPLPADGRRRPLGVVILSGLQIVRAGFLVAQLAGLSLIAYYELGVQPDDAVRSCLVATALARKLNLREGEVAEVFYDSLIEHVGCLGYAHETYRVWGDDVAANRAAQRTNFAAPTELFTAYVPTLLRNRQAQTRYAVSTRVLRGTFETLESKERLHASHGFAA